MNEILGTKPTTQPPILIDSSTNSPTDVSTILDDDEGNRESPFNNNTTEDSGVSAANTNSKEDSADADASGDTSVTEQGDFKPVIGIKRKKNIKLEKMEKAMDKICERVTKGQVESDKLFVELEEKRMKLDYEMMHMEQERRREEAGRAERQKREEREFQLLVFSMLCNSHPDSLYPSQRYYFPQNNDYNSSS